MQPIVSFSDSGCSVVWRIPTLDGFSFFRVFDDANLLSSAYLRVCSVPLVPWLSPAVHILLSHPGWALMSGAPLTLFHSFLSFPAAGDLSLLLLTWSHFA